MHAIKSFHRSGHRSKQDVERMMSSSSSSIWDVCVAPVLCLLMLSRRVGCWDETAKV